MNDTQIRMAAVVLAFTVQASLAEALRIPAFPGAEGFGAYARGGRGGQVLHVTNLDDNGPGSLRWAVQQEGARTVVFAVSGTIDLDRNLTVKSPFITIAGQTAPGDGICLRGATFDIETHDVVVRYIRCRLGDGSHGQGSLQGKDAIGVDQGEDIIVDHCSASWSLDEVLSAAARRPVLNRVTVQWCFITEGLNPDGHSFGSLIRGTGGARYSYLHNLYAHNRGRNPRPGNYDSNPHEEDTEGLLLDFRNNVIYNWGGDHAGYNNDTLSITHLNYVGNYLVPGPDSRPTGIAYSTMSPYNQAYFADNLYNERQPDDPWDLVKYHRSWTDEVIQNYKQPRPFETGPVHEEDARTAYRRVLDIGGASLPKRDAVDARIVGDVLHRTGKIINSQETVGGWPALNAAPAPADADQDGMPDAWETTFRLDPSDPADAVADPDHDGYTNLEEYLNGTDPTVYIDYTKAENNINTLH